jgi:hypothetical protein
MQTHLMRDEEPGRHAGAVKCRALFLGVLSATTLVACANYPSKIEPGMQREAVLSRFGQPSVDVHAPDHEVFIYSTAPYGDLAFAAILGDDGQVERVVQVLTLANFGRIVPHVWTKETILNNYGLPADKRSIRGHETWDFRYRENDVFHSLFTVTFDEDGTVLKTENGPDPMYDGGRDGKK